MKKDMVHEYTKGAYDGRGMGYLGGPEQFAGHRHHILVPDI